MSLPTTVICLDGASDMPSNAQLWYRTCDSVDSGRKGSTSCGGALSSEMCVEVIRTDLARLHTLHRDHTTTQVT
jgi:hypothetical protein